MPYTKEGFFTKLQEMNYALFGVGFFFFLGCVHYSQSCTYKTTTAIFNFVFAFLGMISCTFTWLMNNVVSNDSQRWKDIQQFCMFVYATMALHCIVSTTDSEHILLLSVTALGYILCTSTHTSFILTIASNVLGILSVILLFWHNKRTNYDRIECSMEISILMSFSAGVLHVFPLTVTCMQRKMDIKKTFKDFCWQLSFILHIGLFIIVLFSPTRGWLALLVEEAYTDILIDKINNWQLLYLILQTVILLPICSFSFHCLLNNVNKPGFSHWFINTLIICVLVAAYLAFLKFKYVRWIYVSIAFLILLGSWVMRVASTINFKATQT